MKKVIVLRHAKSSWSDPSLNDHDRPLNARGRRASLIIADWLTHHRHLPDTILCSSSRRTQETVERMRKVAAKLPEPVVEAGLYHAAPGTMLERLRALPGDCETVMLIGHQPGLGSLIRLLSDGREKRRCRRAYEHFPTAAAAVLELDIEDWSELDAKRGRFVDFAKPRELIEA